jgi:hypothetical protein
MIIAKKIIDFADITPLIICYLTMLQRWHRCKYCQVEAVLEAIKNQKKSPAKKPGFLQITGMFIRNRRNG